MTPLIIVIITIIHRHMDCVSGIVSLYSIFGMADAVLLMCTYSHAHLMIVIT